MKPLLGLCLLLLSCAPPSSETDATSGLAIASADYLVLAERTLLAQAETDTILLTELLTPSVCFHPPDSHTDWQGLRAVQAGWQHWQQRQGIASMRLSGLTSLPVHTQAPLALTGRAGIYVICYARADTRYHNGHTSPLLLHAGYHFNEQKRIDYGWLATQPLQ